MRTSLIWKIRNSAIFMRLTSCMTIFFFLFTFYSPSALAVKETIEQEQQQKPIIKGKTAEEKLSKTLQAIKEHVKKNKEKISDRVANESGVIEDLLDIFGLSTLATEDTQILTQLNEDVQQLNEEAMVGFEAIEAQLKEKGLSEEILQRHYDAVAKYQAEYAAFQDKIDQLNAAGTLYDQGDAIEALDSFLDGQKFKRSHQHTDPNNLPFGTPKSDVRQPFTDDKELKELLGQTPASNTEKVLTAIADGLIPSAHADDQPLAEDLAETIDVQITEAITTLAVELNNDPIEIYTWVHNNIRFIPSYGSIQGADMTLQTKRGNAMDTASLLIALLRASNFPARYVYGTVQMPVDEVMNWVGGVNTPEAAGNLMGQGGIPVTMLAQGGQVTHFQLEHTWVEAWVDFEPSRGVKNIQGDNWVPMDASFKQYEFTEGMNLQENEPFDAQALVDEINANATVNETEGWVQNVPQQTIEDQLTQFQQQIEDYINTQNPDATVGEVLGLQDVKIIPAGPLAAGLPYKKVAAQNSFAEVPDNLRHRFRYSLNFQGALGDAGNTILSINEPTVSLAGKKLALSFSPATEQDEAIIESYLPEPDPDTGEIGPTQLPDTLPGYLINLTTEFTIDGEVVQSAAVGTMGTELYETLQLRNPREGWLLPSINHPIAGEYRAIGLDLQGSSPELAAQLQQQMEGTKAKLESQDDTQIQTLTKHGVVGDLMFGTIFSYLALNGVQDEIAAQSSDIVQYRAPSYGMFSTGLTTQYMFGIIPRDVEFSGLSMDVDRYTYQAVDKSNDTSAWINYNQAVGLRASAMEHLVPEKIYSTDEDPVQGISAVKALSIASAEGQKVYTITQDNLNAALAAINLTSESETEIRNAVLAGNIATAHEDQINFNGWVGEGYLLIDPETGAGAYKISGGSNGGWINTVLAFLLILGALTGASQALLLFGSLLSLVVSLTLFLESMQGCVSGVVTILGILGILLLSIFAFASIGWAVAAAWGGILISEGFPSLESALCSITQ